MYEPDRLKVDFWKEMAIWEVYQIPYLFLGYEPPPAHDSYRLDDIVSLDEHDDELRWQYEKLIRDAIDSGALISDPFARTPTTPLRAVDVIKWRKNKTSIEPVQIYLEMEKEIHESETEDKVNQQPTTTRHTQSKDFQPRDAIGRAMKNIAEAYADKGQIVTGEEMIDRLKKQFSASIRSSDKDYFSYTNSIAKKRVILSKANYEKRLTRIRKWNKVNLKQPDTTRH